MGYAPLVEKTGTSRKVSRLEIILRKLTVLSI